MQIGSKHVFADESGDPNLELDKAGVSTYFVVTAVIVDSSVLEEEQNRLQNIIDRYFPGGELKSSKIGGNIARRIRILTELSDIKFKHYSQVIDKSQIYYDSGLAFRRSFIKYINRAIYGHLFEAFTDIHLVADEHGKSDFMKGFAAYLRKRLPPRLFETATFEFADSKKHPFLQVADVIAGTISRAYLEKDPISVLESIRSNTIIIDEWPPRIPGPSRIDNLDELKKLDYLVRNYAYSYASDFVQTNSSSRTTDIQAQVAAVRYLLYHFRTIDPEEYVTTRLIRDHLKELGFPMSERALRSSVIGKLREEGVIIASSPFGIKIPYSVKEIRDFVARVNSQVTPYIGRLSKCRKQFLLATEGRLDIVSKQEFPELHSYIEKSRIENRENK
jgi:hypothetical protein